MQISGANLLIASQQAQKPAPQPHGNAAFAAALKADASAEASSGFEPLPLKKAASPSAPAQEVAPARMPAPSPVARPGQNLDIRV